LVFAASPLKKQY